MIFFLFVFLTSMCKSDITFSFLLSLSNISVSKASLVLTQLKPPISVLSNYLTCSVPVGRAVQHLLASLCTQPLNQLPGLHLRGLNLKFLVGKKTLLKYFTQYYSILEIAYFVKFVQVS